MQPYQEQQPYEVPSPSYSAAPGTQTVNQKDVTAFLAMLAGVGLIVVSCVPGAACVLPIFALVAGIIGVRSADQAAHPSRTRTFAWVAIGAGAITLLAILGLILLYGGIVLAALREAQ